MSKNDTTLILGQEQTVDVLIDAELEIIVSDFKNRVKELSKKYLGNESNIHFSAESDDFKFFILLC